MTTRPAPAARKTPYSWCRRRRTGVAVAAVVAALSVVLASTAVTAQQDTTDTDETTVRIVARKPRERPRRIRPAAAPSG